MKAEISRQLMISASNEIGALAEISNVISENDINVIAICAYAIGERVAIMVVTSDNNGAKKILEEDGYEVSEEEVVLLTLDNEPGKLQKVIQRIADEDIDLNLMYGSVAGDSKEGRLVLISNCNLDVMMIIKTEMERS